MGPTLNVFVLCGMDFKRSDFRSVLYWIMLTLMAHTEDLSALHLAYKGLQIQWKNMNFYRTNSYVTSC